MASVSNVSGIPIVDNTLGMRAQWQPGSWLFEAGYSYDNYFSTSSQYNYLNNNSDYFFTRGAWVFSEHGQLGLEGSTSLTYFSHPPQMNNIGYSVGPYLEWQPDRFITVTLHGGPTTFLCVCRQAQPRPGAKQFDLLLCEPGCDPSNNDFFDCRIARPIVSVNLGINSGTAYTEPIESQNICCAIPPRRG